MREAAKDRPPRTPQRLCQLPTERLISQSPQPRSGGRSVGSLRQLAGKPQNYYLSGILALVSYLSNLLKDT